MFGISKYTGVFESAPVAKGKFGEAAETGGLDGAYRGRLYGKTKKVRNAVVKFLLDTKEMLKKWVFCGNMPQYA